MSVFVSIEDKDGELISDVFDVERIQRRFPSLENSVCVRFISDNEDAFFNQAQLPFLEEELIRVSALELRQDERAELERILSFVRRIAGKRRTYVRFYGERGGE